MHTPNGFHACAGRASESEGFPSGTSIASMASAGSIGSVASAGSIASIASAGSIGSVASLGSIGSIASFGAIGRIGYIGNTPIHVVVRALIDIIRSKRRYTAK